MRWAIIAVVLAVALIMDQLRFSGYYRQQVVGAVENGVQRIGRLFH
jgi:hypothetical protein